MAEPLADGATRPLVAATGAFSMLPEARSTDITSLHEGKDPLTVVVEMRVEAAGTVSAASVYRATVCNRACNFERA